MACPRAGPHAGPHARELMRATILGTLSTSNYLFIKIRLAKRLPE